VGTVGVDLLWIPLGAGAHVVRFSGRVFESLGALVQRRARRDLYHSALEVVLPDGCYVVEMTPVAAGEAASRGVVASGEVGSRRLGRWRIFRYEIHCWRDGVIPDRDHVVGGPVRLSDDPDLARRIVELAAGVPTPVWGRDELRAGEMWNSNSVTSWLLAAAGVDLEQVDLPANGRAPGWDAGRAVAARGTVRGLPAPRRGERRTSRPEPPPRLASPRPWR
jgi:hypothetical protein